MIDPFEKTFFSVNIKEKDGPASTNCTKFDNEILPQFFQCESPSVNPSEIPSESNSLSATANPSGHPSDSTRSVSSEPFGGHSEILSTLKSPSM